MRNNGRSRVSEMRHSTALYAVRRTRKEKNAQACRCSNKLRDPGRDGGAFETEARQTEVAINEPVVEQQMGPAIRKAMNIGVLVSGVPRKKPTDAKNINVKGALEI